MVKAARTPHGVEGSIQLYGSDSTRVSRTYNTQLYCFRVRVHCFYCLFIVPQLPLLFFSQSCELRGRLVSFHHSTDGFWTIQTLIAFDIRRTHTIPVASFWMLCDFNRVWAPSTRLDFMREL